jgi:glycine cleavage system H protein
MATVHGFAFPDDRWYLVEHDTWARVDADGDLTIGLTALGAHISGEFIEFMPKPVGSALEQARSLGVLEMSKVIRAARTPASGTVIAVNEQLRATPDLINRDPYGDGWLIRLRPRAWPSESRMLVTGAAIVAAVEAYMVALGETFGEAPP